jgi:hypothetical protein
MQTQAIHGLRAVGKTSMKKPPGTSLRPRPQVTRRSVGSYFRIGRRNQCGRSFDIKIITMMRSGWEQTARRPRITRRWWAPPGTQDEENQPL